MPFRTVLLPFVFSVTLCLPILAEENLYDLPELRGLTSAEKDDLVKFLANPPWNPINVQANANRLIEDLPVESRIKIFEHAVAYGDLLNYCDPKAVCRTGCSLAYNWVWDRCPARKTSCGSRADRHEANCASKMSLSCAARKQCREDYLADCAQEADGMRAQCDSDFETCSLDALGRRNECNVCCRNSGEGAFDPMTGTNNCAEQHFPEYYNPR